MKNEQARTEKYYKLRESGFTSTEANLLKDRSWAKVNNYCEMNINYLEWRNEIIRKEGRKSAGQFSKN